MPFSHYVSGGIAWLVGTGVLGLEAWRAAMVAVVSDPRVAIDTPIVWDFRRLDSLPNLGEPSTIARTLAALAPGHQVAVITNRPAAFGAALRLEAQTNGQVMAFGPDVLGAVRWLRAHQSV